jgi:hypothetical protein
LKLKCDDPLSNVASNFNLRRYSEGLPQVANGLEGVDPDVIARIEAEIESSINLSDVGIKVFKVGPGGFCSPRHHPYFRP